ncbi:MAG: LamG domain-containing protein [Gammaproteobacteria bacterium]|nr:LamG domain-containing protein [Gammaproteobacteria bacterium]MBI5616400.1 LamG domain-containing protein [Gammaproteobacteria bacterium]
MTKPSLYGYCDKLSVKPGDGVQFMVGGDDVTEADVQIVRLIHGDENPEGPGFLEKEIDASCNGRIKVTKQYTQMGSYVEVADPGQRLAPAGSFTIHAFIWPTTPGKGRQGLLGQWSAASGKGYALGIGTGGRLAFWMGDGTNRVEVTADKPLLARVWYFVAATYDAAAGTISLRQEPVYTAYNSLLSRVAVTDDRVALCVPATSGPAACGGAFLFAGYHDHAPGRGEFVAGLYNGKIDRSGLQGRVLSAEELDAIRAGREPPADHLLARWDTSAGYTDNGIGDIVVDIGPYRCDGLGRNRPVRAMTGYNWNGKNDCFRLAPGEYGGIHFNDDAIIDSGWCPSFKWTLPDDLKSGVYAARLRGGGAEDHLTFFVRPKHATAKIAMLMATSSYLAYANERFVLEALGVELVTGHPLVLNDYDYLLGAHPEFGRSSYDHHGDGAGVCYSSYLRPIMVFRPKHRMASTGVPWQFPADMSIVGWLELMGFEYDVITDEDLHREGASLLRQYNVVLNGTHSEYYSERMMDATEDYLAAGGRVMYLGANGYYWVVAYRDDEPWCMEIRKLDSGSRAWQAAPGEYYMATTGEKGGIWRNRGRLPQKLTGVGFTSEGMDESKPYRRMPDSYLPEVSWVFEGLDKEVFGENGLALGGAAGLELDRYDLGLGTPPGTYLLACSEGHSDNYPHVCEEIMFNYPGVGGTQDFQIRADLTLMPTLNGGAVFSTGSIAWGQALPWKNCDNDVSRLTANVLRRFMQDGPLA